MSPYRKTPVFRHIDMNCKVLTAFSFLLSFAFASSLIAPEVKEAALRGLRHAKENQDCALNMLAERPIECLVSMAKLSVFPANSNLDNNTKASLDRRIQYFKSLDGRELQLEVEERRVAMEAVKLAQLRMAYEIERDCFDRNQMYNVLFFEQQRIWEYDLAARIIEVVHGKLNSLASDLEAEPLQAKHLLHRLQLEFVIALLGLPSIPSSILTGALEGSADQAGELRNLFLGLAENLNEPLQQARAQTLPIPRLRSILELSEPFRMAWRHNCEELVSPALLQMDAWHFEILPFTAGGKSRLTKIMAEIELKMHQVCNDMIVASDVTLIEVMNREQPRIFVLATNGLPVEIFKASTTFVPLRSLTIAKLDRDMFIPILQDIARQCRNSIENINRPDINGASLAQLQVYLKIWNHLQPDDPASVDEILNI